MLLMWSACGLFRNKRYMNKLCVIIIIIIIIIIIFIISMILQYYIRMQTVNHVWRTA